MPAPRNDRSGTAADAGLLQAMASVADATCSAVAVTDADDRIAWVNAGFTRITGWPLDQVRGQTLASLLRPTAAEGADPWPQPRPIGDDGAPERIPLMQLRRRCGAAYWARVDLRLLPAACAPLAHLHLQSDASDSVIAGQRAHEFERWLQLAGSVFGMGLWQIGVRDGVLVWDANLKHMFGLAPEAATPDLREVVDRYVHEEDREHLARALREPPPVGAHAEIEFRIRRLDGALRTIVSRHATIGNEHSREPQRVLGAVVDVTEARGTTLQLRDTLRRLRLSAEASRIGAWERDPATGVGHWDPTMFDLFGLPRSEAAPSRARLLELVHPDDRAGFSLTWKRLADELGPIEYEYRVVRPDGTVVHLVTRAMTELDAGGRPRRALGTAIDVTALRRAERERDRLGQRVQLVAEAVGLGLWEYEPSTRRSTWNDRMYALFGQTRDSFRDRRWLEILHSEDVDPARRAFERTVATGAPFDLEFRVLHADGQTRWIASRGRGELAPDGATARVLGVNWDISDAKRIEQAALAAERSARDLLERMLLATSATGFGLWQSDDRGNRLHWDAQMYRLFGRAPGSDSPQRIWREAVPTEEAARIEALFRATACGGPRFEAEFPVRLPDGSQRWLAARGMQREGNDGRELLGVNWDISERRTAEAALRAQEAAERASAAKTEFLSRMSHELRTPLNAILGFAQLLEIDTRQPLAPAHRERLGHITQAGWHLLELINEVLDLARIEAGATRLEIGAVPLAPLLRECLTLIEANARCRGLALGLDLAPALAPLIRADRTRLKQIVLNLLSNAVKYNRDGGRIDVVAAPAADGGTTIAVRDTGRGMSAEQVSRLFEPFNRLGLESASIEGTGIGLTIALKLAEQMGGRLEASSEAGVGSEFRLTLPSADAAGPASLDSRADLAGCVLCVEDNTDNAELVRQWLKLRPGLTLFHARDGATAQVMAAVCQPDLILLDMRLPDASGVQLVRLLRALPGLADVPCVALSANALDSDIAAARAAGIDQYLTKPLEAATLLRCVDRLLSDPAPRR